MTNTPNQDQGRAQVASEHPALLTNSPDEPAGSPTSPPDDSSEPGSQGGLPLAFYWQVPADELARLRAGNLILEDEGYLAHDIHRGRQLVTLPEVYVPVRDLDPHWTPSTIPEVYTDTIASILQAAAEDGFDTQDIAAQALQSQAALRASSAACIRRK